MKTRSPYVVLAGISIILFFVACIFPALFYWRIVGEQTYVRQIAGSIALQSSREEEARQNEQLLKTTEDKRAQLASFALPVEGTPAFLSRIEAQGKHAHTLVAIGNVAIEQTKGVFDLLNVSLTATGSYGDLTLFLRSVETLPYAVAIDSLTLTTGADKDAWALIFHLTVPLNT